MRTAGLALIVVMASASVLSLSPASSQASPPPSKKPIIALGEMTVRLNDGNPIAKLHADGRTESLGDSKPGKNATFTPGPTLHADGTIDLTKAGFKARVDTDGKVFVVAPNAPEQLAGRIVGDQLLSASGHTGIRVDGKKLIEFADGKDTATIGLIDPPRMKRTALVMTEAFFIDMSIVVK
jgi:hypothetical protein